MKKTLLSLLLSLGWAGMVAAQTGPQIPLSGSVGVPGSSPTLCAASVVMPSDATYTLTASQYACNSLYVTSSVSLTATRNLLAPLNYGQQFTVTNATTGGQSIQIVGSSGAGATIPSGQTVLVNSPNGTSYVSSSASVNLSSPPPIGNTTPNSGQFTAVTAGSYAGNGTTQTVVNLTQGTAAATPPSHTIQFGAPTSVTSSYSALLPTLAPTDSAGDVWVVPNGGGVGAWMAYGAGGGTCGTGNIPCTNTANTFSATQTLSDASGGNPLALTGNAGGTNLSLTSPGLDQFQVYAGGSSFAPNTLSFFGNHSGTSYPLWLMSGTYATAPAGSTIGWLASGNTPGSGDTALSRESAGAIDVGNGTFQNKGGTINLGTANVNTLLQVQPLTAATSGANIGSPPSCLTGFYFNSTSLPDQWCWGVQISAGPTPAHSLVLSETSALSPGLVSLPNVVVQQLTSVSSISAISVSGISSVTSSTASQATSSANVNSGQLGAQGQYWNGSASASDSWGFIDTLGTGTNPSATLKLSHGGSTGAIAVNVPNIGTNVYTIGGLPAASSLPAGTMVVVSNGIATAANPCSTTGTTYQVAITNGTTWSCH